MCIRDSEIRLHASEHRDISDAGRQVLEGPREVFINVSLTCLLYTSDAADERSSVDLGGRRIITKKIHRVLRNRHSSK